MKVVVMGTGFVGLTHAAILAERGLQVVAIDVDADKLAAFASGESSRIERYVNEPQLSACVREGVLRGTLTFAKNVIPHLDEATAVFMCLPTPASADGSTDLSYFQTVTKTMMRALAKTQRRRRLLIVNKSTLPVGTATRLAQTFHAAGLDVGVACNPEFLPQGDAVEASRRPSRIVVGADKEEDFLVLREIYAPHVGHVRIRYIETTPETAEAIKYVSNALLFNYVSFWNGVGARIAEAVPAVDMNDLRLGVTADPRISTWGSYVGNGAGGSCLGKDMRSLVHQMEGAGIPADLLHTILAINERQKTCLLARAEHQLGLCFSGKRVAVLGLAFKKKTNDLRDSSALATIDELLRRGVAQIRTYDPLVPEEAARVWLSPARDPAYRRISYHASAEEALAGSDTLIICNDSEEFRALVPVILRTARPPYAILDGRRMLSEPETLVRAGFDVVAVGSGPQRGRYRLMRAARA